MTETEAPLLPGITLIHNPACSKSRRAKQLLDERGVPYRERRYLEEPLSGAELTELARRLGRRPGDWLRRGEAAVADAGLDSTSTDAAILEAMARFPSLVERPILVFPDAAFVARPPEVVVDLLATSIESRRPIARPE